MDRIVFTSMVYRQAAVPEPVVVSEREPLVVHDDEVEDREPGWNAVVVSLGIAGSAVWVALLATLVFGR